MTTTSPVTTDLVTDYLDAWNAGDPADRRARLSGCAPRTSATSTRSRTSRASRPSTR